MRNKYIPSIASFLIALIVSLPIYSSVVFASLSNPSIKGMDNIAGYVREPDTITISVNAEIAGDSEITPSQLHLGDPSQPDFDECTETATSNIFRCSYTSSDISAASNPFGVSARLYDDSDVENDRIRIEGYKDSLAPDIIAFTSSTVGNIYVNFNYRIEDYIYNGSSGKCVGIKELILTSGTYSKIIPINSGQDNCIYEGSFTENINAITSLTSGNVIIEAKVYDAFGQQSSTAATSFIIDKIAPLIDTASLKILYNNEEIHYFSGPITGAKASVEVEGSDIATVTMDLSSIKESYPVRKANCNNGFCILNNVEIDLSSGGDYEIIINATDNLGNSRVESIYYNFIFDDEEPIPSPIKTNHPDSRGNYYLGNTNNTITMEIEEAGVGFNNRNVYLDLRNINNNQNAQADECIKESDILWRCYWRNVRVAASDGSKQIAIKSNSVDDLGNPITGTMTYNLIVDITAPIINEITYSPAAPTSSDTIIFNIRFSDGSNEAKITVDSSSISTVPMHTDYCTSTDCSINVGDLISSYTVANVPITLEDPAGNKATRGKQVTIYQADPDTIPNFFSIRDIEIIPPRIDKMVASQIPINVFVHVILQRAGSGRIISMTPDCSEMANSLAASPYLVNEYSDDPYIALQTNQAVGTLEQNLLVKCKLRLQVMDNQNIYTKFEEEYINAELELYGNSLGDMGDAVKEKLEGINAEIESVDKDIEKYQKWIGTWGRWCQISEALGMLNAVLQGIKAAIHLVMSAAWFACAALTFGAYPCMKANEAAWYGSTCVTLSRYHSMAIEMLIWPSGYISPFLIGLINKWSCMIAFHCAMCNINDIFNIGVSITTSMAAQSINTVESGDGTRIREGSQVNVDGIWEGTIVNVNNQEGTIDVADSTGEVYTVNAGRVTTIRTPKTTYTTSTGEGITEEYWEPGAEPAAQDTNIKPTTTTTEEGWRAGQGNTNADRKGYLYNNYEKSEVNDPRTGAQIRDKSSGREWVYKGYEMGWQRVYTGWEEQGKVTSATASDGWLFNPYKSIHYAKSCLCMPAIVYNLKKEKQITCMQRNCITNHVTNGLPTTECDIAYKERHCLYVEGAEFKKHGFRNMLDNLWEWAKDNSAFLAASLGYLAACMKYIITPEAICSAAFVEGTPAGGYYPSLCGIWGSAMTTMEMINVFSSKFSFLNYEQDLEGEDYCATGNYQQ